MGVGLLGGSLGMALRKQRLAGAVVGYVRRAASVRECLKAGAVDGATMDLHEAVAGADLIVFCTPIGQMPALAAAMLPALKPDVVVTDVGSVKGPLVRELEPLFARAGAAFVGSHPMAGAERMGVKAARPDLFHNAVCVVTPTRKSHPGAVRQVANLWRSVGGRLMNLSPDEHDQLVSLSSHLPHLVAAGLANLVLGPRRRRELELLCAGGFRDTTRIASGSPEMWRDIASANRQNIAAALGAMIGHMQAMQRSLEKGDTRGLAQFFTQAKTRRDRWAQKSGVRSPE